MSEPNDWNARIIAEFRAHDGRVGGNFEGAPLVLLHHRGRRSGREYVNPVMYLPDEGDPDRIYVFASKAGAPDHPEWYRNLTAAGSGRVERSMSWTPSRCSRCRTIWLTADCVRPLACAAWEKLRQRATSQNIWRHSICMASMISSA